MNINATLICQLFIFAIFYKIVQTKIWPSFNKILLDRQLQIAEGLESAEKAKQTLSAAKAEADQIIAEARVKVDTMIDQAVQQSDLIKSKAHQEAKTILAHAHNQSLEKIKVLQKDFQESAKHHYAELIQAAFSKVLETDVESELVKKIVVQALNNIEST